MTLTSLAMSWPDWVYAAMAIVMAIKFVKE